MKATGMALIGGLVLLAGMSEVEAAPETLATAPSPAIAAAAEVEDDASPMRSRQATGVILGVDREAKTVTIKARGGERTFSLAPRVQIKLGKTRTGLDDLQPGKRVFIRYRDVEGIATATTVKVL